MNCCRPATSACVLRLLENSTMLAITSTSATTPSAESVPNCQALNICATPMPTPRTLTRPLPAQQAGDTNSVAQRSRRGPAPAQHQACRHETSRDQRQRQRVRLGQRPAPARDDGAFDQQRRAEAFLEVRVVPEPGECQQLVDRAEI